MSTIEAETPLCHPCWSLPQCSGTLEKSVSGDSRSWSIGRGCCYSFAFFETALMNSQANLRVHMELRLFLSSLYYCCHFPCAGLQVWTTIHSCLNILISRSPKAFNFRKFYLQDLTLGMRESQRKTHTFPTKHGINKQPCTHSCTQHIVGTETEG